MPYFTTSDGTRLHYRIAGKGSPTLIFIHGWCSNLDHWEPQARSFASRHRVLRVDLRGHGRSDAPERGYSIRQFAADVAALAGSLRVRGAVVAGHSMGRLVAIELAGRHPRVAKAVVLADPALGIGRPRGPVDESPIVRELRGPGYPAPVTQFYERLFSEAKDRRLAARVVADAARTPQHVALGAMRAFRIFWNSAAAGGKRVKQPVLTVVASDSPVTSEAQRMLLPDGQFAQVVGAGHFLQLEAPEQFNAMLRRFIQTL